MVSIGAPVLDIAILACNYWHKTIPRPVFKSFAKFSSIPKFALFIFVFDRFKNAIVLFDS